MYKNTTAAPAPAPPTTRNIKYVNDAHARLHMPYDCRNRKPK